MEYSGFWRKEKDEWSDERNSLAKSLAVPLPVVVGVE